MKKAPFNPTKEKLKICYSFMRELRHWERIASDEDANLYNKDYKLIESRIRDLRYHIDRYFPHNIKQACSDMFAEKMNDLDKYRGAFWVHEQAKKTWGNSLDNWKRGKRVQDLITFGSLSDIPF